jgi:hypothetical protein
VRWGFPPPPNLFLPAVFPDMMAPVVRADPDEERELFLNGDAPCS